MIRALMEANGQDYRVRVKGGEQVGVDRMKNGRLLAGIAWVCGGNVVMSRTALQALIRAAKEWSKRPREEEESPIPEQEAVQLDEVYSLRTIIEKLLLSADVSWLSGSQGHDWREAAADAWKALGEGENNAGQ